MGSFIVMCMIPWYRRWVLSLLFFSATWVDCRSQSVFFHHLNVEDGLSQNSVLCITKDSRGFMWFGTRFGLNKYDSRRLTVYKNRPGDSSSISGDYILSLLSDSRQTLWVGTRNGLNKYNAATNTFERIPLPDSSPAGRAYINCLYEDSKGRIWIGTSQTLYLLTGKEKPVITSFTNHTSFPQRGVLCVYEDKNGTIWAGTYVGLVKITATGNDFSALTYRHDASNAASLSDDQVTAIVQDPAGPLWIGTLNGGLNLFDPQKGSFSHFTDADPSPTRLVNNHIRKMVLDEKGRLWIGTQEGLSILDVHARTFTAYINDPWNKNSLSQNSVHSLYRDKNTSTVWIGTFFGGVNYYTPYSTEITVYNNRSRPYGLNNNVVSGIEEDDYNNLWIGTEGGGLNCVDQHTGRVTYYEHRAGDDGSIGSNLVKTVYKDREGNIWAGTHGGGLNLFEPQTKRFTKFLYKKDDPQTLGQEIACLLEDSKGIFWIGTETAGVKLFRKKGKTLSPYPEGAVVSAAIGNKSILSFLETSRQKIWVGTASGLYIVTGNKVQLLEEKSGYPFYVNCLTEDEQGNIWVGTYYNGIIVYNEAGVKIAAYTQQSGLPDNNVLGILQDSRKQCWISGGNGLARLDAATKKFTVYTESDGLAGNAFNTHSYFKSRDGRLFFGGFNGLSAFYPERMQSSHLAPPVFITAMTLFNQPVDINGEDKILSQDISFTSQLQLSHSQNVFSFDFAMLNYVKPDKNRYAYKLEGYDNDWNYTSAGSASFTNVPPGNYTFIVKGANNNGDWSAPAMLQVSVLPPFWKTWWAYSIYGLLFLALTFFIARYFFLRTLLKRNLELTQYKLNFFTNISHEIRTHLSLIIGPAEKLLLTSNKDSQDQAPLQAIRNNSENLLQLVNELMDFRKAETGHLPLQVAQWDIVALTGAVFESFTDQSVTRNIQAGFFPSSPVIPMWLDKFQFEKVLYNLLSNAYKFTPDGGQVAVTITERRSSVEVKVADNGRGISKENIGKLFDNYFQEDDTGKQNTGYGIGLALSKSIVELHKGSLTVSSEVMTGSEAHTTCFTVALLKGREHFGKEQIVAIQPAAISLLSRQLPALEIPVSSDAAELPAGANTILLVEDNISIRSLVKDALYKQYHILECSNGQEGLALATETIPDLIISDVMMPEMDGLTFCNHIKTDARTSHIPVILLTAKTAVAHHISGLQTGADIYLTKPFSIQVLELQARNLLRSRERLWQQFQQQLQLPATGNNSDGALMDAEASSTVAGTRLHPIDEAFLQKIIHMVEEQMDDPSFGIALLAKQAAMSQPVLFKKIKAITGMTANDFVKSLRLKKAKELLKENRHTVYEVAFMVGYESSKYFSREFKKQYGQTPSEYAKQDDPLANDAGRSGPSQQ